MGFTPKFRLRDIVRVVPKSRFPVWMNQYHGQNFEVCSISFSSAVEAPYTLKGHHHAFREDELELVSRGGIAYTGKEITMYRPANIVPVREVKFNFERMFK